MQTPTSGLAAGRRERVPKSTNWLFIVLGVQMVLFVMFFIGFFHMEQRRQDELDGMQVELHRLRKDNLRSSKRLLHANSRMLKYEQQIKDELDGNGGGGLPGDDDGDDDGVNADGGADDEDADAVEDEEAEAEEAKADGNGAAHAHAHPPRDAAPAPAGSKLSKPLQGRCLQLNQHDFWVYEVCLGVSARQFHRDDEAASRADEPSSHGLGSYVAADGGLAAVQRYKHGDACGSVGHGSRSSEVRLRCSLGARKLALVEVREPSTCQYLFTVEVPQRTCERAGIGAEAVGAEAGGVTGAEDGGAEAEAEAARADEDEEAAKARRGLPKAMPAGEPSDGLRRAGHPGHAGGGGGGGGGSGGGELPPETREQTLSELQGLAFSGEESIPLKRLAVVHGLRHAWRGYEAIAWGADEVKPMVRKGAGGYGLGLMILDSLDVLWLAGLKEDFHKGVGWVASSLNLGGQHKISFFETTIRCLAGLLSA